MPAEEMSFFFFFPPPHFHSLKATKKKKQNIKTNGDEMVIHSLWPFKMLQLRPLHSLFSMMKRRVGLFKCKNPHWMGVQASLARVLPVLTLIFEKINKSKGGWIILKIIMCSELSVNPAWGWAANAVWQRGRWLSTLLRSLFVKYVAQIVELL